MPGSAGLARVEAVVYVKGSIDDPAKAPAHVTAGRYIGKGDGSPRFRPVNRGQWGCPECRPRWRGSISGARRGR